MSLNIDGTIFITSGSSPQNLLSIAAHEAWHSLEVSMSAAEIENINAQLADSEYSWGHGYYDSMLERRARAFQMWCMRLIEGLPGHFVGNRNGWGIDAVFARAWSGSTGAIFDGPDELERSVA
jgi:hypothetical protein